MIEWEYRIMLDGSDDGPHRALNDGSMSEEEYHRLRANNKNRDRGTWIEKRLKAGAWERLTKAEHHFHPVHEGCTKCAALPGEDVECEPPERTSNEYLPVESRGA